MGATRSLAVRFVAAVFVFLFTACGDSSGVDGSVPDDTAPPDAASPVRGPAIDWLERGQPDGIVLPCPDGWRELVDSRGGATTCDPYPEGGAETCADGEAHFPGEPGCIAVGSACATDGWPSDLPADARVVYVSAGATAGTGSRDAPYGTTTEFSWGSLGTGAVVALGRGRYEAPILLPSGVTLWGACVGETVLSPTEPSLEGGAVELRGAGAVVRNLSIRDTNRAGVRLDQAGTGVRVEDVWIELVQGQGLIAGRAVELEARSVVIRNIRSVAGMFGRGADIEAGARARISRAVIEGTPEPGIFVSAIGADATVEDTVVRDVDARGISIESGAVGRVERVLVERTRDAGIGVFWSGSEGTISQSVVRETRARADGRAGHGIAVREFNAAHIDRTLIERADLAGLLTDRSDVTLRGSVVRDGNEGHLDRCIAGLLRGRLELRDSVVERCLGVGVYVAGGPVALTAEDLAVRDVESRLDGGGGRGIELAGESDLTRVAVSRIREVGLYLGRSATLIARDLLVDGVREAGCGSDGGCAAAFGTGIGVFGATADIERFGARGAALCGVHVASDGGLDLRVGEVAHNAIGACVQVPDYDLGRLQDRVAYFDNGTPLESMELPVPDPSPPLSP